MTLGGAAGLVAIVEVDPEEVQVHMVEVDPEEGTVKTDHQTEVVAMAQETIEEETDEVEAQGAPKVVTNGAVDKTMIEVVMEVVIEVGRETTEVVEVREEADTLRVASCAVLMASDSLETSFKVKIEFRCRKLTES